MDEKPNLQFAVSPKVGDKFMTHDGSVLEWDGTAWVPDQFLVVSTKDVKGSDLICDAGYPILDTREPKELIRISRDHVKFSNGTTIPVDVFVTSIRALADFVDSISKANRP